MSAAQKGPMQFVENVFAPLLRFIDEGRPVALATLIHVEGSSPRPAGSMIGVDAEGRAVGMITGGCAGKAIIEEARQCIEQRANKIVRYGAGSPYVDVILPCGSGIDLFFDTISAEEIVRKISSLHAARKPAFMAVDTNTNTAAAASIAPKRKSPGVFVARYNPDYQIFAFGEGVSLIAFCSIAKKAGFDVTAFSPDAEALRLLKGANVDGRSIHQDTDFRALEIDAYTAMITLFHEHEWEAPILHAALNSPAGYIGALGSRKTHETRLEALNSLPHTHRPTSEIHGPVGLDIGAINPNEIAISILAEIIKSQRR